MLAIRACWQARSTVSRDGTVTSARTSTVAAKRFVDASNPGRADQTRRAFDGLIGSSGLDRVDAKELIRRLEDPQFCRLILASAGVSSTSWLVAVEQIPDWETWTSTVWPRARKSLKGPRPTPVTSADGVA
jgi:hypothetical protein